MKKVHNEDNDLFLEIIRKKSFETNNEFKSNCLYLSSENVTVTELGQIIGKQASEIIAFFWNKGQIVSKNQSLSPELLESYCQSKNIKIKKREGINFSEIIREYLEKKANKKAELTERPPIITIMGHIDHGKTTLLDTVRHTNLQSKEVGGITQRVSVSQIEFEGKKITLLDTPGHSDFIKMRQRGISLTDIVVLVIDGKDGIMSQTEEIITYLHKYKLPVIVFINHKRPEETDNESNLSRIRTQLQENNLTPLEWGGETIVVSGNAKNTENAKYLLENILLLAEFKADLQIPASGVVIDSYLHRQTSARINELLIQGGKLQEKDTILLNGRFGKVKMISDLAGNKITTAFPSDIVRVVGLTVSAELGDKFLVVNNEETRRAIEEELANYLAKKKKLTIPIVKEKKSVNLILLADSQNALEALSSLVQKKGTSNFNFSVVYTATGQLNNSTIDLAKVTHSNILVFGLQLNQRLIKIIKENNIPFFSSKIIYEIDDKLQEIIQQQQEKIKVEKECGSAQITTVFYFSKTGKIAGCRVTEGTINRNNFVHILRKGEKVFTGKIESLQSNKIPVKEVKGGQECGIVLKGFDNFQEGDQITAFQIIEENVS